jgi:hypothetical protein
MPTDPSPSNLHTDPLIHHGRHFGRAIYAFANIQALLLAGLGADKDSPPETQQLSSTSRLCSQAGDLFFQGEEGAARLQKAPHHDP